MPRSDPVPPPPHTHTLQGELSRLQYEVAQQRRAEDVVGSALSQPAAQRQRNNRAHLEVNLAAALALQSPQEWKRWLITYVRQLSADADEVGERGRRGGQEGGRRGACMQGCRGGVRRGASMHGVQKR